MLSLEIIGCSGAVPEAGGACSCYLVRGGGATLLLDCGPGALPRLATRVMVLRTMPRKPGRAGGSPPNRRTTADRSRTCRS